MPGLSQLLDWLYPPRCALCGLVARPVVCPECLAEMPPATEGARGWDPALSWVSSLYGFEGRAAQAVKRLKYARVTALAQPMSELLEAQRQRLADHDVIVPVPIHPSRKRMRGFNQSVLLCQSMPRELVCDAVLWRSRKTRPQVELNREQRLANLRGAFEVREQLDGLSVLIVDDVVTSGGTAVACAQALRAAGATEVGLLTFCGERSTD